MADEESTLPAPNQAEPKRRGRPRAAEEGVTLTTYVPLAMSVKIREKAAAEGVSVAQCIRDVLKLRPPSQ